MRHELTPEFQYDLLLAVTRMAKEVPPPYEPPVAASAPPAVTDMLYRLMRDFLPAGIVEALVLQAADPHIPNTAMNPELKSLADRLARQLAYEATADGA